MIIVIRNLIDVDSKKICKINTANFNNPAISKFFRTLPAGKDALQFAKIFAFLSAEIHLLEPSHSYQIQKCYILKCLDLKSCKGNEWFVFLSKSLFYQASLFSSLFIIMIFSLF